MTVKTIREQAFGKAAVRLVQTQTGLKALVLSGGKVAQSFDGMDADKLWAAAVAAVGKSAPGFWGYADAIQRFRNIFADGFSNADYISSERAYKATAAKFIGEHLPLEAAKHPTPELCEIANKAFAKTNMATPIEKTRVQALLRSSKGVAYLSAVAELAEGGKTALPRLDALMREHGQPSWPCATYLPFFWKNQSAMFLKPQITKDFAKRVGHRFVSDYDARLNWETYASLLDLAEECERELTALAPADRIDVQSFIWVVGEYPDPQEAE